MQKRRPTPRQVFATIERTSRCKKRARRVSDPARVGSVRSGCGAFHQNQGHLPRNKAVARHCLDSAAERPRPSRPYHGRSKSCRTCHIPATAAANKRYPCFTYDSIRTAYCSWAPRKPRLVTEYFAWRPNSIASTAPEADAAVLPVYARGRRRRARNPPRGGEEPPREMRPSCDGQREADRLGGRIRTAGRPGHRRTRHPAIPPARPAPSCA